MGFSNVQYILFLDTFLSSSSISILFGLWPFQGLFHSWMFKNSSYTWTTHVEMGWFNIGCLGLFVTNLQALLTFDDTTGHASYRLVFVTNALTHGLWGLHNLHQFVLHVQTEGQGTVNELRRPYPLMLWSTLGVCGSSMVRNIYASWVSTGVSMEDYNFGIIVITWIWEWLALAWILLDFGYFVVKELKWGGNVLSDEEIQLIILEHGDNNNEQAITAISV